MTRCRISRTARSATRDPASCFLSRTLPAEEGREVVTDLRTPSGGAILRRAIGRRSPMKRKILKNVHGQILGFEDEDEHGHTYAKNVHGQLLGRYDRHRNLTVNQHGRTVAHGDANSALILNGSKKRRPRP